MAKKPKKTRKELLKDPDEFMTISGKLIGFAIDHKTQISYAVGTIVVLALMWDGPTANPKHPKAGSTNQYHILVGVHGQRLWVNGEAVAKNTPAALQKALLKAARNPGRRKELHKYGVGKG